MHKKGLRIRPLRRRVTLSLARARVMCRHLGLADTPAQRRGETSCTAGALRKKQLLPIPKKGECHWGKGGEGALAARHPRQSPIQSPRALIEEAKVRKKQRRKRKKDRRILPSFPQASSTHRCRKAKGAEEAMAEVATLVLMDGVGGGHSELKWVAEKKKTTISTHGF